MAKRDNTVQIRFQADMLDLMQAVEDLQDVIDSDALSPDLDLSDSKAQFDKFIKQVKGQFAHLENQMKITPNIDETSLKDMLQTLNVMNDMLGRVNSTFTGVFTALDVETAHRYASAFGDIGDAVDSVSTKTRRFGDSLISSMDTKNIKKQMDATTKSVEEQEKVLRIAEGKQKHNFSEKELNTFGSKKKGKLVAEQENLDQELDAFLKKTKKSI